MNIWIKLLTVFIELFLVWYFYSGMLGSSNRYPICQIAIGILYFCIMSILSMCVNATMIRTCVIMLFTYFSAKIYFDKPWIDTIYPTVLFFLFAMLSDVLCGTILQTVGVPSDALMGAGADRLVFNSIGKILHLFFLYLVLNVIKTKADKQSIVMALPLFSCHLLSIFMCCQNYISVINGDNARIAIHETIGLIYINLIICAYIEILNQLHEKEQKAEREKQMLEIQRNYYQEIMTRQEETRILWHDIKKYVASISALVENDNRAEAHRCLDNIHSAVVGADNYIDTGNTIVDSILTYGINKAVAAQVVIKPEIWVDSCLNFPATDLFVIIGNTIDNAIEACCQIDDAEKLIYLSLIQKNHILFYEIKNPYKIDQEQKKGKIHGYGLKNVRACVEHGNGKMSVSQNDGMYIVSISLNLST